MPAQNYQQPQDAWRPSSKPQETEHIEIEDSERETQQTEPQEEPITLEALQKEASEDETTKGSDSLNAILSHFEGVRIGWLLEFLEEELLRLEEEKRMQAFYLIALNKRQHREAAEAGLRQRENLRREEAQKFMTAANEVHRNEVNIFMEKVVKEEYELISDENARDEIEKISRIITKESKLKLKEGGSSTEAAGDLVTNFLMPEIYKRVERRNRQMSEKRSRDMMEDILDSILLKHWGVPGPTEEMYIIVICMIEDIIVRSMPIDECSETSSEEDSARYEAKMAVKKILRTFMPKRTWMYSKERIADCTIDDIIQEFLEDLSDTQVTKYRKRGDGVGSMIDYVISTASVAGVPIEFYKEISKFNVITIDSETSSSSSSSTKSSELFSCLSEKKQAIKLIKNDTLRSSKSVIFKDNFVRRSIVEADLKDMVEKEDRITDFSSTDSDD